MGLECSILSNCPYFTESTNHKRECVIDQADILTDDLARDCIAESCVHCIGTERKRATITDRYTTAPAGLNNCAIAQLYPPTSAVDLCRCLFASTCVNFDGHSLTVYQSEVSRTYGRKAHRVKDRRWRLHVLPCRTCVTRDVRAIKGLAWRLDVNDDSARLDICGTNLIPSIESQITRVLDEEAHCVATIFRHQINGKLHVDVTDVIPLARPVYCP